MKGILAAAVLFAVPVVASGLVEEIKMALAGCAALDVETARLDCFEQLTKAIAQMPGETPPPRESRFKGSAAPGGRGPARMEPRADLGVGRTSRAWRA